MAPGGQRCQAERLGRTRDSAHTAESLALIGNAQVRPRDAAPGPASAATRYDAGARIAGQACRTVLP